MHHLCLRYFFQKSKGELTMDTFKTSCWHSAKIFFCIHYFMMWVNDYIIYLFMYLLVSYPYNVLDIIKISSETLTPFALHQENKLLFCFVLSFKRLQWQMCAQFETLSRFFLKLLLHLLFISLLSRIDRFFIPMGRFLSQLFVFTQPPHHRTLSR